MRVEFQRTGERRYGVVIHRDAFPPLSMDPAPGYDELVPHDLQHFIVEKELGLRRGIFGQIADGGTAGTFRAAETATGGRNGSRRRRSLNDRGRKLLDQGQADCALSERATYVCMHDWLSKSSDPQLMARAREMKINAQSILRTMTDAERRIFNEDFLARTRRQLDELSRRWSALRPGESLILEWPSRR